MAFGAATLVDVFSTVANGAKRQHTMILQVLADASQTATDGKDSESPLFAVNVPPIWADFTTIPFGGPTYDNRAFCVSKTAMRPDKESWRKWYVTCQFETLSRDQKKRQLHPLLRPAEITDSGSIYLVSKHLDINGTPILNGAKQLFNPANQFDEARGTITVTRNLPARLDKRQWVNHVNSDPFDVYDPGELKIQEINQVRHIEEWDQLGDGNSEEVEFYEVSVVFEENPITTVNPNGWQPTILNAGRKQLTGGVLDNSDVRDPPWALTAAGAFIAEANLPGGENYIEPTVYPTANFAGMGLFA